MNTRTGAYIQAIRGPVLLVTIGVLFAIHQAGIISFSRTWPLLIIVIGVMKLLERSMGGAPLPAQPAGPYPPQTGAHEQYTGRAEPRYTGPSVPPSGSGGTNA
ncbi:MAG TPA: DUF5668 domain-containing protein [Bryobacteraceae bacterium]|jgi:hypothetical protein